MSKGSCDPPIQCRHNHAGLFTIIKRQHIVTYDLAGFVTLARDQQSISRPQRIHCQQNGFGAVIHLGGFWRALHHSRPDCCRIFGARVVICDVDHIGVLRSCLPHQGAFGRVAITASADNHNQAPHHMRAHRLKRGRHRIRRMGVVHKYRGTVFPSGRQLHPSAHTFEFMQHFKDPLWLSPTGDGQAGRQQDVFRLKPAQQI
mmetsp:Transcript_28852/g.54928  ORF Transcript_28852/g.54928 Transcript_28852/m.54928 type:complete len:202 (-) Transcript_28852:3810-4415(-)